MMVYEFVKNMISRWHKKSSMRLKLTGLLKTKRKTDKIITAGRLILNIFVISNLVSFSTYYTVADLNHSEESLKKWS